MKFSRLAFASLVFSADLLLVVVAVEQRELRWGRELSFHSGVDVGGERGEGEEKDPFMLRYPSLACLRCCVESVVFCCRMHTPYINPVCRAYKLFLGPGPKSLLQGKEERERGIARSLPAPEQKEQ